MENFIDYVEAYFQLTPSDEHKGVREMHQDFNKQTYRLQTTSHQDSLCMSISEHSNGLASTIECKCDKKKQDKCLSNHHFPLHHTQKTKHHCSDPRYAALKCYSINFQWVFRMQLIGGGGERINKTLEDVEFTLEGVLGKTFTKIEAHAGMAERLVGYLAIEEALQEEIKHTLEHNNQSYGDWCAL